MGLRQEKFGKQIQRDLGELFQQHRNEWLHGEFATISGVMVSPDLGYAKVYMSLFNSKKRGEVMNSLHEHSKQIRHELARKLKNQVRKIPELAFFEDETLDYVDKIDKLFDSLNDKNKS